MRERISDYARLLRLPGIGGLATAPVFGAISVGYFELNGLIILFLIGAFSTIFGFVLNDVVDVEVDKLSKELYNRPLVKGTISKNTAIGICIFSAVASFAIIFLFFYKDYIAFYIGVLCLILPAILGTIYNYYGKRFIGSDILVGLSEGLLVLFGGYIVLESGSINILTWTIAILTFNQMLYMNAIEGGLKDSDHDYLKNVKNIALVLGVKVDKSKNLIIPTSFKIIGLSIRLFSAGLLFIPFVYYKGSYELWHLGLLSFFTLFFLALSIKFITLPKFDRNKIRRLIMGQALVRYMVVPIMLIPFIGNLNAFILLILPFVWYAVFTNLIIEKLTDL